MNESQVTTKSFWDKVGRVLGAAGREVIEKALILYYAWMRPDTPRWAKAVILGALAYFISPIDLIPDPIPVAGYVDDAAVISAAVAQIAASIDDSVIRKAKAKADKLFG